MIHAVRSRPKSIVTACTLGVLALGVVMSGGCDREDHVALALDAAGRDLESIHPGGAATADAATRLRVYTRVVNDLRDAARDGTDAQKDAANMLLASAHGGLSQIHAAEAGGFESNLLDQATRLRAILDLYAGQAALAAAMGAIEPRVEREELDRAIADARTRGEEARSLRATLQTEHDDLVARAEAESSRARDMFAEAGRLRSASLDAATDDVARLAQEAYEINRRAAEAENAAADLRAQAEKVRPRIAEQDLIIASTRGAQASLTESRRLVDERAADARERATAARADAERAASDLAAALDQMESIRSGPLAEAWSNAVREAEAAARAVSQARGIERSTLAMRRGETQQRVGEFHAARARGLERALGTLDLLDAAEPPLPFSNRLGEIRATITSALDEARASARSAFDEALAAHQSSGVRDQAVRDRLDRIRAMLGAEDPATADPDASNPE